tara:strand:+ start:454 stop:1413 length:960 start_codon:yes stop_codon:yes gene_type:complete
MSRRTRSPGPIKDSDASPKGKFRNDFKSDWVSINPCPEGVLPTDVDTLTSDDIDNGTPGVWYHYDPNNVFDISGHSSDWVARDANGVEFYCDLAAMKEQEMDNSEMDSGRCATALMKPDGTGVLAWSDMVGCTIEFLIESHENCPHDENHDTGIVVGISNKTIGDTTDFGNHYSVGAVYSGDASSNADQLGFVMYNCQSAHTSYNNITDDCRKVWAQFHFVQRDADNIVCATCIGLPLKSDGTMVHQNYQAEIDQKSGSNMAFATDNVYLFVSPFARDNTGNGTAVRRTGKFKMWYRMVFSEDEFEPTYDPNSNNRQGS